MDTTIERKIAKIRKIVSDYQNEPLVKGGKFVNASELSNLSEIPSELEDTYHKKKDFNSPLLIGIMGAKKTGKSSSINSLFLADRDFKLPTNELPETASIVNLYNTEEKREKAVVFFYSAKEWADIKSKYEIYNSGAGGENERAAYNRYTKVASQVNVTEFIGTVSEIRLSNLENYVSADGIYTPLVKQLNIEVNSPFLNGIGLVDTPGLYDVNTDRSKMTDDYIKSLDVVLFFSPTTQFLSETELEHLMKVKAIGVSTIIIVASKFDSAFLTRTSGNFLEDCKNFKYSLEQSKKDLIKSFKEKKFKDDPNQLSILTELEQCKIFFYSSYFDKYARNLKLSSEETDLIDKLKKKYANLSPVLVKSIINGELFFSDFIENCKKQKRQIVEQNLQTFAINIFSPLVTFFRSRVENSREKIRFLNDNDLSKIISSKDIIVNFLEQNQESINEEIHKAFEKCEKSVMGDVWKFIDNFDRSVYEQLSLNFQNKTRLVSYTYFLFFRWNERYETYTEITGNIPETKRKIPNIVPEVNGMIVNLLKKEYQQKHIDVLRGELINIFKNSPNNIKDILNYALNQIVSEIKFIEFRGIETVDLSPLEKLARTTNTPENFGDVDRLQRVANSVVSSYMEKEKQSIIDYSEAWKKEITDAKSLFQNQIKSKILNELSIIEKNLEKKKDVIKSEEDFIAITERYIEMCIA